VLSRKIEDALNRQLNAELYSAYLYLSMSAHFRSADLPGAASWMKIQAQEELAHAEKFFDFVNERGGRVKLAEISTPPAEWDSALAAFEAACAHEQKVTGLITNLVGLARSEKDRATETFLQWFVDEQAEEESSVGAIVKKLALVGDEESSLVAVVDGELGLRTFVSAQARD
jgi:ferritin